MNVQTNPFSLVRASDYTVDQINALWVELGASVINAIIEPRSRTSIFILGGKGTGKTHLLRYHSYPAVRLRAVKDSGLAIIEKHKFLGIFIRATSVDAGRFEPSTPASRKWQQLFGVYFELCLVEGVLSALVDVQNTSPQDDFNAAAFIEALSRSVHDAGARSWRTLEDVKVWVEQEKRSIDDAVNNAAFSGSLEMRVAFAIGALSIPLSQALSKWHPLFSDVPLIYLVDEIENFTESQQQVLNSLVRYGEGVATFRITGRLYSRKTNSTIADGEENREGSEFKTTVLDERLRTFQKYSEFAHRFVAKRLAAAGKIAPRGAQSAREFDPRDCFEEIDSSEHYTRALKVLGVSSETLSFLKVFMNTLREADPVWGIRDDAEVIFATLAGEFSVLLQKLNFLLFCKKAKKGTSQLALARRIANEAIEFCGTGVPLKGPYHNAYGHWASDLFAQLCRESRKQQRPLYAGFDTFVKMSSGNPRNLLVILGRAYEIAAFKELDFINGPKLSVAMQTDAAIEAARFMFERDTNYGSQAERARDAVSRFAAILRTARYALNIPEVSPLAVSFADADLGAESRRVLDSALNYSLVFEVWEGRPDRNSQSLHRKIQLNPLLSPRWGLPISRRGDIPLSGELLNAVFDSNQNKEFDILLKSLQARWNSPFKSVSDDDSLQNSLF
jgi:hypothetical protein